MQQENVLPKGGRDKPAQHARLACTCPSAWASLGASLCSFLPSFSFLPSLFPSLLPSFLVHARVCTNAQVNACILFSSAPTTSFLPPFSDGAGELQGWIFLRASSPRPTQLLLFRSAPSFAADGGGCQSQEKVDASSRKTVVIMLISKRMGCLA